MAEKYCLPPNFACLFNGIMTYPKSQDVLSPSKKLIQVLTWHKPAKAHEMNGSMRRTRAFCEFYEEQARCAFRLIADGVAVIEKAVIEKAG